MTESEAIKKAIRHFECMKNDAVVVLDSGFGTHPGESDLVYRNRKMYAELTINALEKQIAKKPYIQQDNRNNDCMECPSCDSFIGYECDCRDEHYQIGYCPNCGQAIDWSDEE